MNRLFEHYSRFISLLDYVCGKSVFILLMTMLIIVNMEIISRSFFSYSFSWVVEIAKYMVVWVAFLGGICASNKESHPTITALLSKLNPRYHALLFMSSHVMTIIGLGGMGYLGITFTNSGNSMSMTSLPNMPMSIIYIAIPIGCFGMALCTARRVIKFSIESRIKNITDSDNNCICNEESK